jgi:L-glutamine-phosphate cytidylyltransferase
VKPSEALILAAGVGSRLTERHQGSPKCLVPVGGRSILARQLAALRISGVERVVVVTGYEADQVETAARAAAPDLRFTFIRNSEFRTSNVLTSWLLGSHHLRGDYIYMHADTVFDPALLATLLLERSHAEVVLSVDRHSCGDEEMKVVVAGDHVADVSKTIDCDVADGEFTGVLFASSESTERLQAIATDLLSKPDGSKKFFEAALQVAIRSSAIEVKWVDITGIRWREIDFPEDLDAANALFAD